MTCGCEEEVNGGMLITHDPPPPKPPTHGFPGTAKATNRIRGMVDKWPLLLPTAAYNWNSSSKPWTSVTFLICFRPNFTSPFFLDSKNQNWKTEGMEIKSIHSVWASLNFMPVDPHKKENQMSGGEFCITNEIFQIHTKISLNSVYILQ